MRSLLPLSGALFTVLLGVSAPACASENSFIGTGIGAAVGGLLGSQFGHGSGQVAATGLGVAVGGLIGNDIGHDMDRQSPRYATSTSSAMYSEASPLSYGSDYAPNYVAPPAPPPTYVNQAAGTYCREYSQEIRIGSQLQESYGTACLQPDGSWRVVQ